MALAMPRGQRLQTPLGVPPHLLAPVLDKLGVVLEFGLEVGEAALQDEDLVRDVLSVPFELVSRLRVYL